MMISERDGSKPRQRPCQVKIFDDPTRLARALLNNDVRAWKTTNFTVPFLSFRSPASDGRAFFALQRDLSERVPKVGSKRK